MKSLIFGGMISVYRLYKNIWSELEPLYGEREARSIAQRVIEHFYGMGREVILGDPDRQMAPNPDITRAIKRLIGGEPVQYVLGETEFFGRRFLVDRNTLIPRPETEELVQWIIEEHREGTGTLLDIGTGSGCIAVSLAAELTGWNVSAIDISEGALEAARKNAVIHHVNVNYYLCDILAQTPEGAFDVIVSNPPYVGEEEKSFMMPHVLDHEPHQALFVPDGDPLLFYRVIAEKGRTLFTPGGSLYVEINERYGLEVCNLLQGIGYVMIELKKDLSGKDRMVRAVWE